MAWNSPSKEELETRLETLQLQYDLAKAGLLRGVVPILAAILGILATVTMAFFSILLGREPLLSGFQTVSTVLILAAAIVVYDSFVFGRTVKVRAELSETKKLLELSSGEDVRGKR
ncbi:MAG: hypothetical protein O7H41_01820 [Planctomycetota bacterium]|nr:hypothetical protein [Planctomycetota bacterium]